MEDSERTALGAFAINILLFILKITAAMASGSLAVLSSAFDSLNDILSYFIGYWSIKEARKLPDADHPFGHRRIEPFAAIIMGIFAGILAFEIIKSAGMNLLVGKEKINITIFPFAVLLFTIIVKFGMHLFLKTKSQKTMSTALDAMSVDCRNDVLFNFVALFGITGAYFGYLVFDDLIAVLIGAYIAYSGYKMAKRNFDYMVGAKPDEKTMKEILKKANVGGVKKIGEVMAHYVGDRVHVAINIVIDKKTDGPKSHEIAVSVQKAVESLKTVEKAFVHVDYE
jgi:cation diffusion facilitator family transporter